MSRIINKEFAISWKLQTLFILIRCLCNPGGSVALPVRFVLLLFPLFNLVLMFFFE